MSVRNVIGRLFGYPYLSVRYRPHFRIALAVHPLILKLIEDTEDGVTRRMSLAEWHRAHLAVGRLARAGRHVVGV